MKLSQAGRLYLKDYYILNEAHKDVVDFLNQIQKAIHESFTDRKAEIPIVYGFEWKTWSAKSNPGYIAIWAQSEKELPLFQKGKEDLSLGYSDVRHDSNLETTDLVSLSIRSANVLRNKLNNTEENILHSAIATASKYGVTLRFNQRVNYSAQVPINLEDALESAESITDALINCCMAMNDFIGVLVKGESPVV